MVRLSRKPRTITSSVGADRVRTLRLVMSRLRAARTIVVTLGGSARWAGRRKVKGGR